MTAKTAQRTPEFDASLLLVVYQDGREIYRIQGMPQMPATKMAAAINSHDDLLAVLRDINDMACYASEEDTDSREAMLLKIGETARAAIARANRP